MRINRALAEKLHLKVRKGYGTPDYVDMHKLSDAIQGMLLALFLFGFGAVMVFIALSASIESDKERAHWQSICDKFVPNGKNYLTEDGGDRVCVNTETKERIKL